MDRDVRRMALLLAIAGGLKLHRLKRVIAGGLSAVLQLLATGVCVGSLCWQTIDNYR